MSPSEGSPAFRAGLKTNDLITRVDDTAVKGLSLNEAVKRMRGEPNTKVILTIFRKDENRTFPVTIVREEIRTVTVRGKVVEPGYAWIRLSQFQERTVEDFARKVEEIYKQETQLKGLVLDLRNDPGGLLDAAVAISAAFLPENVNVVSTNGQLAESKFIYKAAPGFYPRRAGADPIRRLPAALKNVPLVVLVNEGSASASSIFDKSYILWIPWLPLSILSRLQFVNTRQTVGLLQQETPAFIPPELWPPNSPVLNPVDYKVW